MLQINELLLPLFSLRECLISQEFCVCTLFSTPYGIRNKHKLVCCPFKQDVEKLIIQWCLDVKFLLLHSTANCMANQKQFLFLTEINNGIWEKDKLLC